MSTTGIIRWTRQTDGSYFKEGTTPADIPTARIFVIDEDYETNPHAACPGLKLRPKEEAIELVERKIAEGSYRVWRYEVRTELPSTEAAPVPTMADNSPSLASSNRLYRCTSLVFMIVQRAC